MKRLALLIALAAVSLGASCVTPGAHAELRPDVDEAGEYVLVNGAWLRVLDVGPKDSALAPVVMVHGYGSRLEAWRAIQPALAEGRRAIAFDQRGFGLSERPATGYGPEAHARDVLALLDELDVERPVLVGHSYGSGVVLRAALALGLSGCAAPLSCPPSRWRTRS